MQALSSMLALMPRWVLGALIVQLIWPTYARGGLLTKSFLAGPVGVGISSLLGFVWIWTGLPLRSYVIVETGATIVIALWLGRRNRDLIRRSLSGHSFATRSDWVWPALLLSAGIVFVGSQFALAAQQPHGRVDAWVNWNVVARFIYRGGPDWQNTFQRAYDHPDYPLLLGMSNAITWGLMQRESARSPMVLNLLFALSTTGLVTALLYTLGEIKQAALAGILLLAQPIVIYSTAIQYADMPLSFYILASAGLLPIFSAKREAGIATLAGLTAGLAAWTKNEGIIFVLLTTLIWAGLALRLDRRIFRHFLAGVFFPVAVVALFKIFLAPGNDLLGGLNTIGPNLLDPERHRLILSMGGRMLWNLGGGRISLWLVLLIVWLVFGGSARPSGGLQLAGLIVIAQLAAYYMIYLLASFDLRWHLQTSLNRLYLHLLPLAVFCLFAWTASPDKLLDESRVYAARD